MATVEFCKNAEDDLDRLEKADSVVWRRIVSILEQVETDDSYAQKLFEHGVHDDFNACRWLRLRDEKGQNVWRFKTWLPFFEEDIFHYRVIYRAIPPDQFTREITVVLLAIVHTSEIDYDNEDSELGKRIAADYDEIGH